MSVVDKVALLDDFLQEISERLRLRRKSASVAPSPTASISPAITTGREQTAKHGSGNDQGGGRAAGVPVEGDIRAVTSGGVPSGVGSPEGENSTRHPDLQEVQEEVLRVLDFLFHTDRALVDSCAQVLEKSQVVEVVARKSGRSVWLVQGSRGAPYLCLRQYCSCRSFQELIRRSPQPVLCKHLLAVRLAPALGVARQEIVEDDKLVQRMSGCDYG